jgi:hypothetical protein
MPDTPKRGRPPAGAAKRVRRNIAADPRLLRRWVKRAEREGLSLSALIERAMTRYMDPGR